ncbi:MAG: hypothetical protein R3F20_01240 [Planctomycetota bacterium]
MHITQTFFSRTSAVFAAAILAFAFAAPAARGQAAAQFADAAIEAVKAGDFAKLGDMVVAQKNLAQNAFFNLELRICTYHESAPPEQIEDYKSTLNQLGIIYKLRHNDARLAEREQWFKKLGPPQYAKRVEALQAYDKGIEANDNATKTANEADYRTAIGEYTKSANASLEIADWWFAYGAAFRNGWCYRKIDDNFAAAYWFKKAEAFAEKGGEQTKSSLDETRGAMQELRTYDKIKRDDLIDINLDLEASRKKHEEDYKKSLVVEVDPGSGNAGAEGGVLRPPVPEAEFEWVDDEGFKADKVDLSRQHFPWFPLQWNAENPTTEPFYYLAEFKKDAKDLEFRFLGEQATADWDGKLRIDPDGPDGKDRGKIVKLKKGKPVNFTYTAYYDDGGERDITVELVDIALQEKVYGTPFKWADQGQLIFRIRGASAIKGKLRGNDVTIVDCNSSSRFNDYGEDAIIIGKGKDARVEPLGRYVYLQQESGLYPYEVKIVRKDGNLMRSRPYNGELAPLRVEYETKSGIRPTFLVAQGSGEASDFFIDLTRAMDGIVWVPATTLKIYRGYFITGKGRNEGSVLIGPGRSRGFKIETGKINVWKLGGAGEKGFWLDAKIKHEDGDPSVVEVIGKSLRVYGNDGEEYFNFLGGRPTPKVELRRGDANGSRIGTEEMKEPSGTSIPRDEYFFPSTVKVKNAKGDVVGRLELSKHPIFGDAASEWIKAD